MSLHPRPTAPRSPPRTVRPDNRSNDATRATVAPSPSHPSSLISQRHPRHTTTIPTNTVGTATIEYHRHSNHGLDNNSTMQSGSAANQQMERVTFHLFTRLCNFGLNHTTYRTRKLLENLLLVGAICCGGALLMLHRTFVVTLATSSSPAVAAVTATSHTTAGVPSTCLDRLEGFDPGAADLTHLVILPRNLTIGTVEGTVEDTTNAIKRNVELEIESESVVLWNRGTGKSSTATPSSTTKTTTTIAEDPAATCCGDGGASSGACKARGDEDDDDQNHYYREWLDRQLESNTLPIEYSYSTTKAYLMLPHDHAWLKRDLDVQYILLAPTDPVCFGEPFVQFLLWNCYVGGNTVLLNWLLTFPAHEIAAAQTTQPNHEDRRFHRDRRPKAYIYNPRTELLKEIGGNLRDETTTGGGGGFVSSSPRWNKFLAKVGVFLRTSFLFFFCTTLVSFTLRETQERMLDFTRELSRRVRHSLSVSDLITTHLVQNLLFVPIMLGMMFFLMEFYNGDKFLAFAISSIIWSVEGYSLICLRSIQGLSYFPYFFFLLFLLFHVYQTAFSEHGFVYMALTVLWCFVLHSMVFFWHRYELPALVLGAVSIDRPRMIPGGAAAVAADPALRRYDHPQASSLSSSSLDRHPHLVAPWLTETANSSPTTFPEQQAPTRNLNSNSSSSLLGGGGSSSGFLASRQSFQSTSTGSRRTWGLYQPNLEDDSSTGSHLYFMGGEVVVRRPRRPPGNHSGNHPSSNGQGQGRTNHTSSGSDLSPPAIRRGGLQEVETATLVVEATLPPLSTVVRNESYYSLLSTASDAYGCIGSNHAPGGGNTCNIHPQQINGGNTSNATNNSITASNNSAIGLDFSGREDGEDHIAATDNPESAFCDTLPNDTSMDTVHISNVSNQPTHQNTHGAETNGASAAVSDNHDNDDGSATTTETSDGYYAQEVGGLQAIFESKLTPRHRNSQGAPVGAPADLQQPPPPSSSTATHYQRRPPTFPELASPNEAIGRN